MAIQLQQDAQTLVDVLLYEKDKAKRNDAVKAIAGHKDKDQIEKYLIERLASDKDPWHTTWSLTALAAIDLPDGRNEILKHVSEQNEPDAWVRHFALINAANFSPFPQKEIEEATQDNEILPQATAFRLLLANGQDHFADEIQKMLEDTHVPDARWAAARALRNRTDLLMKPLREHIENRFIHPLVEIVSEANIYMDIRWEAIQSLASFQSRQGEVAERLSDLLTTVPDSTLRRYCLEALIILDQAQESQNGLLTALEDKDAQIRLDAANTLKKMLGAEKSIQLILPRARGRDKDTALLVDALRHIDSNQAAREIRDALSNPDIKVSSQANQLLTELGGQAATQILMNERAKALDNYTVILNDADNDVRVHFKELMLQAKIAFWLSLIMHVVVFVIGVWMLFASLSTALDRGLPVLSTWIGVGGAGAGALAILLSAFYRNPLKNVRGSLNALMQVDVVFLGYVRQINQIDATFKHMFLDNRDFGTEQMKGTVTEIQSSVKAILGEIKDHIQEK